MTTKLVPINLIAANPWQPRSSDSEEHIANMATSIADDGLMQIPSARMVGDHYELAFGHSRLAAFVMLADLQRKLAEHTPIEFEDESPLARAVKAADMSQENGNEFTSMPLNIMDIDDETMFRFAISENVQRKDLNAIETAKAMRRYRDEFRKSSADIGSLFGVNDATVRGKLRLLDFPVDTQARLASGEMSEGVARTLLSAQKILGAEKINELAGEVAGYKNPAEVMESAGLQIARLKSTTIMWDARYKPQGLAPCGGDGLWPLTWTYKLSFPEAKFLTKNWTGEKTIERLVLGARNKYSIAEVFEAIEKMITSPLQPRSWDWIKEYLPEWAEAAQYMQDLSEPPACIACPLYVRMDNYHYCGSKVCWKRKLVEWGDEQFRAYVKKTGIAVLTDDEKANAYKLNWNDSDPYKDLIAKHDANLRLVQHYKEYNSHYATNHRWAELVDLSEERKEAREKIAVEERSNDDWARNIALRDASDKFLEENTVYFLSLFGNLEGINLDALKALTYLPANDRSISSESLRSIFISGKHEDKLQVIKNILVSKAINNRIDYGTKKDGPVKTAKHLKGLAMTWGVKLPENWLDIAAGYEPFKELEPVSVETEVESVDAE